MIHNMGRTRKSSGTSTHYINAQEFSDELFRCQQDGELSVKMYRFFQILARKCSGSFVYTDNEDRQDCINHAVMIMGRSFMKFDFNKKARANAFSYFTSVALNGLRQAWNQLNGHNAVTYRIDQIFKED